MVCQIRCTLRGWIYRSLLGYGHFLDVVRLSRMDGRIGRLGRMGGVSRSSTLCILSSLTEIKP
jgi:hypothetical protein